MTQAPASPFLHHLEHLLGGPSAAALTDGELLERFLANRDETAIAVLVRRYGPLVLAACRRVLHDAHAAEDAFQATFLVLTRKAPSLDRARPLGNWLYTVAYRLALRARANDRRRQRCEEQVARARPAAGAPGPSDLVVAVEEELHKLPPKHHAPLVLCYLEGKTNDQAAQALGCPRGSMSARLARARERLGERLARRGIVLPAAGIAAALTTAGARAAVPLPLLDNTVRAALWFARQDAGAADFVSAHALALARSAFRAMLLTRLGAAGALLLAVVLLGTGATMLLKAGPPAPVDGPPRPHATAKAGAPGALPDLGANAALKYGQAFAALPHFTTAERKKLETECLVMPLDARARQLVTRADYALRMMRRGSALSRCDWGIGTEEGIEHRLPHATAARALSALACLQARIRFEEGKTAEAIDDLVATLTLARHVSQDGYLVGILAGYEIERRASECLALYLPSLDAGRIKALKKRLNALPTGGSPAATMPTEEKVSLDWLVRKVKEAKDKEKLLAVFADIFSPREARAFLEECGGTAKGVIKFAEEMRPWFALRAKMLALPLDQFEKWEREESKKRAGNPVFKRFAPAIIRTRGLQAQADVRRALFLAALDVQLDGPAALKKHRDPVAGGSFEYVPFKGGFELRSKAKPGPLVLTAGRRGK